MTDDLAQYRAFERQLWMIRWLREGQGSAEEDAILDAMEVRWMNLSGEEQAALRSEGPNCWPMEASSAPPHVANMPPCQAPAPWAYEGFHSSAEAILSVDAA